MQNVYQKYFKRIMDIVLSLFVLIVLSPALLFTAYLIIKKLGSPVLFRQDRPGKDCKIFKMYKFRSMIDETDKNGILLPDELRLTPFGKKLRSTSIDELPELINVLKGEMSIVGPRPLSTLYLPFYNEFEQQRHHVLPGITGWAQINGRNALSWRKKFEYDVYYVHNLSFAFDCKIMLDTAVKVIRRTNIGQGTDAPESFHLERERELEKTRQAK